MWLSAAIKINHGEGGAENPDIACSNDGVFVVWEDDRDGELENKQGTSIARWTWVRRGKRRMCSRRRPQRDTISLGPNVEVVGSDVCGRFDSVNGAYDIYVAASGNNGTDWREPVRVDSDAQGAAHSAWPQLAA